MCRTGRCRSEQTVTLRGVALAAALALPMAVPPSTAAAADAARAAAAQGQELAQSPTDDPLPWIARGLTAIGKGEYGEAALGLRRALAGGVKPTLEFLFWLGLSQVKSGDALRGIQNLKKSLPKADPARRRHAHLAIGEAYRKKSDCQRAVPEFLMVRDGDPKYREPPTRMAAAYLADCYLRLGRFDAALEAARTAAIIFRNSGDRVEQGFAVRIGAFARLGLGNRAGAMKLLKRVGRLNPDYELETDMPAFFAAIGALHKSQDLLSLQGYLGASLSNTQSGGVRIASVVANGPAQRAGLQIGDRIVTANGHAIADARTLAKGVSAAGPGAILKLAFHRGSGKMRLPVVLQSRIDGGISPRQIGALVKWHIPRHRAVAAAERAEATGDITEAFVIYWRLVRTQPPDSEVLRRLIQLARVVKPAPLVPFKVRRLALAGIAGFAKAANPAAADKAIGHMENALRRAPWWADAYLNLGLMHGARGNHGLATVYLRLFLDAQPNAPESARVKRRIRELRKRADHPQR